MSDAEAQQPPTPGPSGIAQSRMPDHGHPEAASTEIPNHSVAVQMPPTLQKQKQGLPAVPKTLPDVQPRSTSVIVPTRAARSQSSSLRPPIDERKRILEFDIVTEDFDSPRSWSEEYDPSREDPRIVHDVQQVLKFKARREARNFSGQTTLGKDAVVAYDVASRSSFSDTSSPQRIAFPPIIPPIGPSFNTEADIDFSPSTTLAMSLPLHPVPTLSIDGKSLDWASAPPNDDKYERRWTLSISKRKDKEKASVPQSSNIAAQESLYAKKLARIKSQVTTSTSRKAAITAGQLQRRYDVLYGSLARESIPLNIACIARWNGGLDGLLRTSFEKTEPFTWLKHLEKPGTKPSTRLMWHLNALIVEEYCHSLTIQPRSHHSDDGHDIDSASAMTRPSLSSRRSPNRVSLRYSLDPFLSRKLSHEGQVSFEPRAESVREPQEGESRRSIEGFRGSKYRTSNQNDSGRNSIKSVLSAVSQTIPRASSLINSPPDHVNLTRNVGRKPGNGSDMSSNRGSISDLSDIDRKGTRSPKRQSRQADMLPSDRVDSAATNPNIVVVISGDPHDAEGAPFTDPASPLSGKVARSSEVVSDSEPSMLNPSRRRRSHAQSIEGIHRIFDRRVHTSVHSPDRSRLWPQLRSPEVEDDGLYREYEVKAQLLDDAAAHNYVVRQILHRIAAGVREYETIQANFMTMLGVPYKKIPQDLLDSFSHDPSAVTGATRRFHAWRAVEDTHHRLLQQRDTFRKFISSTRQAGVSPPRESVLQGPIASVQQVLQALDAQQQQIASEVTEVANILTQVKAIHATVKKQYNDTLAHTSVQYPELSHIAALEESYRDLYQQFWEFGLDALTFLLDTVTPFWRNYGRIIGRDVQDFLIVPLYRNEFTGEPKRYAIKQFPRRSFRHWIGLLLFFVLAVAVTSLQARAAFTSILHFRLRSITHAGLRYLLLPFFWMSIIIQWAAVMGELAVVVTQLGIVVWWLGWSMKFVD